MTDYSRDIAKRFINMHQSSDAIDLTGYYGPQSTDLATLYIRDLLGFDWNWAGGHARDLLQLSGLRQWFDEVQPSRLQPGDVVAMLGFDTSDFGTVGIFVNFHPTDNKVRLFTQTPMRPQIIEFEYESIVGGLRYRYQQKLADVIAPPNKHFRDRRPLPMSCSVHTDCVKMIKREQFITNKAAAVTHPAEPRATLAEWMLIANEYKQHGDRQCADLSDVEKTDGEKCIEDYDAYAARHMNRPSRTTRFLNWLTGK